MTSELIDYITQIKGFENSLDKFYQVVVGNDDFIPSQKLMFEINEMFENMMSDGFLKSKFLVTTDIIEIKGEGDD